jgi:peptidoglycan/LPS O-acetylase OafA/YrhL
MSLHKFLGITISDNRVYGLDILRAAAILFVVVGHSGYLIETEIFRFINPFLFDGVSIFFVLSGYLIGGILIRLFLRSDFQFKDLLVFWKRRWLRTLPTYFLILALLLFLNFIFTDFFSFKYLVNFLTFTQNFSSPHPGFFPEAWSLSIEEWFYLIVPLMMFLFFKYIKVSVKFTVIWISVFVILFCSYYRYQCYSSGLIMDLSDWDSILRKQVITRLDSMIYGVIFAYLNLNFKIFWVSKKNMLFVIGVLLFVLDKFYLQPELSLGLYHSVFSFGVISIATSFLIPKLTSIKKGSGILYSAITIISLISYPMYLVNLSLVQYWILEYLNTLYFFKLNSYLRLVLLYSSYWIFTIGISIIIYKYFEIPILKLRDKHIRQ